MEFTVYTFGDVEIFRAALAGVAMIFNADGFFVSDGGLGLGALTALGLLLGLMVILVNGIITQKIELGGFIVMVIVFSILFVPKFSVNVEDYNGDAIAKVDNVPLGVALPAGLVSGLAREMNIRMGTAFSTVQGYPSGLMTPEALSSPLKMLLSLRNGYQVLPERNPVLVSNMANLVAYCLAGRELGTPNFQSIKIKDAPITALLEAANTVSGLTLYADPETRISSLRTCKDAALSIDTAINTLADSSDLTEILTAAAARKRAAPIRVTAGVPEVLPVTASIQADNLAMLFQVNANAADNFIKTTLLMPYISRAYLCADASSDPVSWAQCMPFQSSITQAQEDSAAAGTTFQRMMFHGMNALFFIWICLSPVVAVLMLMMGVKGLKLAGSYLMFGAWTVSWYIGASVVNFYMLKQLQYELSMLGTLDNLTPTTIGWFFDTISTKFAAAGEMMAAVPLIMMTVMSGSMYGMVQLANRWGSRDYYDEKVNTPSTFGSAAIHAALPGVTMKHGGVTQKMTLGEGESFDTSSARKMASRTAAKSEMQFQQSYGKGLATAFDHAKQNGTLQTKLTQTGEQLAAQGQTKQAEAYQRMQQAIANHEISEQEAVQAMYEYGVGTKGSGQGQRTGKREEKSNTGSEARARSLAGTIMGMAGVHADINKSGTTSAAEADKNSDSRGHSQSGSAEASYTDTHSTNWQELRQAASTVASVFTDKDSTTYSNELRQAASYAISAEDSLAVENADTSAHAVSSTQMSAHIKEAPESSKFLRAKQAEYMLHPDSDAARIFNPTYDESLRMYGHLQGTDKETAALARALKRTAEVTHNPTAEQDYVTFTSMATAARGRVWVNPADISRETHAGLQQEAGSVAEKGKSLSPHTPGATKGINSKFIPTKDDYKSGPNIVRNESTKQQAQVAKDGKRAVAQHTAKSGQVSASNVTDVPNPQLEK